MSFSQFNTTKAQLLDVLSRAIPDMPLLVPDLGDSVPVTIQPLLCGIAAVACILTDEEPINVAWDLILDRTTNWNLFLINSEVAAFIIAGGERSQIPELLPRLIHSYSGTDLAFEVRQEILTNLEAFQCWSSASIPYRMMINHAFLKHKNLDYACI